MLKTLFITLTLMIALPAVAQTGNPKAELAGRIPGKPANCIEVDRVGGPMIYGPSAVLYRQSGARIWRMTPAESCPSLRYFAHLSYRNTGRRMCIGDRFDVTPPGSAIASGHCRIGELVPYDKAR